MLERTKDHKVYGNRTGAAPMWCGNRISTHRVERIVHQASRGSLAHSEDAVWDVGVQVLRDYMEHHRDNKSSSHKMLRAVNRAVTVWATRELESKSPTVAHLARRYRLHFEDLAAGLAELTASQDLV